MIEAASLYFSDLGIESISMHGIRDKKEVETFIVFYFN